jgi:serine/threonine-protein kinase
MVGYCEYAPDHGPIFLISKFVAGQDIDKYVAEHITRPDRIEKICTAMYQVLDALEYVHSRGVIHRDIKPSNIMVEGDSNVRLMDLGIARMNGGNKFSAYGFIGTPQYAAPEQILRDKAGSVQINAATDIYALGITFYELLTGKNPYNCDTEVDTLTRQMRDALPNNETIPRRLMNVLWKATEKEQSKRYQKAADFREAIKEAMLPPKSFMDRIKTWFT